VQLGEANEHTHSLLKPVLRHRVEAEKTVVPREEYKTHMTHTVLEHYMYLYSCPSGQLVVLGYGSLLNHNSSPNLDYRVDEEALTVTYLAARDLVAGEEATIYYGANLWFEDSSKKADVTTHNHMDDEASVLGAIDL